MRAVLLLLASAVVVLADFTALNKDYDVYCVGNCSKPVVTKPAGGFALMGGGTDVDAAFAWMIQQSANGDFVVLRASGTDAYNPYIQSLGKTNSVTTIVLKTRNGSYASEVLTIVTGAEAIFFAGGDQWVYIQQWGDTPLSAAVQMRIFDKAVVGGTSAGLAILGEFIFTAANDTVESTQALADPYDYRVTLGHRFVDITLLKHIITDSHFVTRDRMGRLITFVGRLLADSWAISTQLAGLGIDEETAILIDLSGLGKMSGTGTAYVVKSSLATPETCKKQTPLTFSGLAMTRLSQGDTYDFTKGTASASAVAYKVDVKAGTIVGSPYGP